MLVGMLIIALAMFLLGPSPLLPIPPSMLSLTVIALMLLGLGQSMVRCYQLPRYRKVRMVIQSDNVHPWRCTGFGAQHGLDARFL